MNALGVPDGVNVLNDDVVQSAVGGVTDAALAFEANIVVATLADGIAALLGESAADGKAVFAALAELIYAGTGPLDLADPAAIEQLVQDGTDRLGVTIDPALKTGGATVLAGIVARIKSIPAPDGRAFVRELTQIQKAAQTETFPMLAEAAAGRMTIDDAVAAQTGDEFEREVDGEEVGVLTAAISNGSPLYAIAAEPGGQTIVRVYDRQTNLLVASFFALDSKFTGGVSVAVGDVTGDGVPDVVVATGPGGGPHVIVIDGTKLDRVGAHGQIDPTALVASFFAFEESFTGGATVCLARVDGGLGLNIVVGAGAGGGPHVRTFAWTPGDNDGAT